MLRSLTFFAAGAALAGTLALALGADAGAMEGTVQPHAVEIVVRQPDAVTTVSYDTPAAGLEEGRTKVIVRRALNGTDSLAPKLIRRQCPQDGAEAERHVDAVAPQLRS